MKKQAPKKRTKLLAPENGRRPANPLGLELERIREKAVASGMKLLSLAEIRREVARRRGAA